MSAPALPEIRLTSTLAETDAGLLAVPLFDSDGLDGLAAVDDATSGALARAVAGREATGAPYEQWWSHVPPSAGWRVTRLLACGAGTRERWTVDAVRRWASAVTAVARQRRQATVALLVKEVSGASTTRVVQALAEGVVLAHHDTGHLKSEPPAHPGLQQVALVGTAGGSELAAAVERGRVLGACTNLARALGNEPSNVLTPRELAERARAAAEGTSLAVTIHDEKAIADLGMGLLLGVAKGSAEPPRLIVLEHNPPGRPAGPVLGLVGKGITFDTGGISIKPADGMERMKVDMAGGAAVIGALRAASLLGAPVRVIGVIPSTENMPGGKAIKPGDVIRGAAGKSVEVINTDAEGRLILGDGLWYARHLGATHLIDIATLTGACVVALGRVMAGVFGGPPAFVEAVRATGDLTGDRCWPMPSSDEYFDQLKSEVADITNTGGRPGGAVTAAVFLKQFAGGLPWAHLDIAGVAWSDDARPWQVKGATGAATRLLAELALNPEILKS